jgi:glycosyltransferase involved in cell wall biosynthesis
MDGGSTDESVEVIRRYERWITAWVSEPDGGQSQAINSGFSQSTGWVLGWLNSDDVYTPGALHAVAETLDGMTMTLLIGDSIITDGPDRLDGRFDRRRPEWSEMVYGAKTFPQPSVFWTRDLWETCGGVDEDLYFAMDYDLWLRMLPCAERVVFLDRVLSVARTHSEQKGARAQTAGSLGSFREQRANAALRAALSCGEPGFLWLLKVWVRRISQSVRSRSLTGLFTMEFPITALRITLKHWLGQYSRSK